jgi:hypothetical protein
VETSLVLKLLGLTALLVCVILIFTPVGRADDGRNCGSVVAPEKLSYFPFTSPSGCRSVVGNRLTLSLVIGAGGAVALYGSSQVKKREDD